MYSFVVKGRAMRIKMFTMMDPHQMYAKPESFKKLHSISFFRSKKYLKECRSDDCLPKRLHFIAFCVL